MTSDPESTLFDFAASNRVPTNEEEKTVTELHAAIGTTGVPLRLRRPPVAPRFTRAKLPWRKYMYAAVTLALVLAVATAGFLAVQQQSSTPSPTEVPEVVLGLAGQDSDSTAPITETTCNITGDVPIFAGLNSSPISGPAVLVTLDRELKLVCDGEETLLAEDVMMANPTQTPHVLQATTMEGTVLLNIVTDERLLIPFDPQPEQSQRIEANGWGDWLIFPSSDDNSMASLYNLETFTEHPIETSDGRVTREAISEARSAQNATGDTFVLPISVVRETDSTYLAGFVVASGDGTVRFVETGQDPAPRQIAVSPAGEMIATSSYQGAPGGGSTTTSIYSAANGEVLDTWTHETRDTFFDLSWLDDGSALLFSDGSALYKVTEPGGEHEILFEGERLQGLTLTNDEDVVTIWHVTNSEPGQGEYETAIINIETGEVSSLAGRDLWAGPTYTAKRSTLVLAEEVQATPGQTQTLTAVDAVTGDIIDDFEYTVPDGRGFSQSSWGNERGDIEVLAFSPNSMWLLVDANGNPTLEQIAPPPIDPDVGSEAVFLVNSPEGYLALRIYEPYSTWLMLPGQQEWIQVDIVEPQDSPGVLPSVSFVTGIPKSSQTAATATPEPDGTPVASPVTAAACDFEPDTPIIIGADSAQFEGTNLIITPSGEMNLVCGDSETTLAANVDFAFPTSAPNVVMVETTHGMSLINIAIGDSLDFPYSAMIVLQNQHLVSAWGSWMVMPSSDDQTLASIVDLRTLTEIPITVSLDHRVQESAIAGLSVNTSDTHAVVAVSFNHSSSSRYLQGFFIVDAEGGHRFIHTQSDVLPRTSTISPDGETIATSWYQGTLESGETNISLYNSMDGEVIESWILRTADIQTELSWLGDGSGVVFTDGTALYRLDAQHPGDGFQVLVEGPEVSGILLTPDPNVVAVSITEQQEQGPPTSKTTIVNLETGETTTLDGRDLWASSYGPTPTRTVLVLLDFFNWHAEDSLTLTVVDSVTGEEIGEIEHNPPGQISISNATSQRNQGDVDVFSLSADTTWQLLDENDQPHLQQIPPPDGRSEISGSDLLVAMNRDGQIVMTFFDPFEVWLWQPDTGEWTTLDVAPPDNDLGLPIVVMFIPGDD